MNEEDRLAFGTFAIMVLALIAFGAWEALT